MWRVSARPIENLISFKFYIWILQVCTSVTSTFWESAPSEHPYKTTTALEQNWQKLSSILLQQLFHQCLVYADCIIKCYYFIVIRHLINRILDTINTTNAVQRTNNHGTGTNHNLQTYIQSSSYHNYRRVAAFLFNNFCNTEADYSLLQ